MLKIRSLQYVLSACLLAFAAGGLRAATCVVDGITWTYTVRDGEAALGDYIQGLRAVASSTEGALAVPSELGGVPVTSIGYAAFSDCSGLTSVTIPSSVTSIGDQAFYKCRGLTSVTIPSSVTSIGSSAFYDCSGLTSVTIPSSVTSIGESAFWGCSSLTSVTIPEGVTSIGRHAFRDCSGLTSVTILSSVMSIENDTFLGCSGLTSVTIPSSVTSIEDYAFNHCSGLTEILVDAMNVAYCSVDGALYNKEISRLVLCPSGKTGDLTIPAGVTSIGAYALEDCSGLTSVTIPSGVTSIALGAFEDCSSLTSVTIPSSVTSIGNSAFNGCGRLTSVTIPSSVTSIGNSAFNGCGRLTSVTIPSSVTSIGESAFNGCSGLTSLTIPSSVTSIGDNVIKGCNALGVVHVDRGDTSRVQRLLRGGGLDLFGVDFVEEGFDIPGQPSVVVITNYVPVTETTYVTNAVSVTNVVERPVYVTVTNRVLVTVTNVVEAVGADLGTISAELMAFEPGAGFDGAAPQKQNGVVCDEDGRLVGIAQITTAKATAKGVKVGGFLVLQDGKKQSLKAVTAPVADGRLVVSTKVGRLGTLELTLGGDGFRGRLGRMTVVSAAYGEDTGMLSGSLSLQYFDAKGALKKKKITISGMAAEDAAWGETSSGRGQPTRAFSAELK